MSARAWGALGALAVLACASPNAGAQSLAQRVAAAPAGRVQFSFATRADVCGDGRSYVRVVSDRGGSFYGSFNDVTAEPCVHGPARVVLDRAGGEVVGLRVFVGPPDSERVNDLGPVSARDAAGYLLHLAESAQGAVARDAIMPAMLADSVDNRDALVSLARDKAQSREVRRSAVSWLGRDADAPASLVQTLVSLATDETDNQSVRQQALSTLARLPGGAGIPTLTHLADDAQGGWMATTALSVIAQSGDPRARDYLRGVVQKAALPDEALAAAVRSFGQQYATAVDIKLIRDAFPKFTGERSQGAAIAAAAEFGGADNAAWLLSLASNMNTTANVTPPRARVRHAGGCEDRRSGGALRSHHRSRHQVRHHLGPERDRRSRGHRQTARHRPAGRQRCRPPSRGLGARPVVGPTGEGGVGGHCGGTVMG